MPATASRKSLSALTFFRPRVFNSRAHLPCLPDAPTLTCRAAAAKAAAKASSLQKLFKGEPPSVVKVAQLLNSVVGRNFARLVSANGNNVTFTAPVPKPVMCVILELLHEHDESVAAESVLRACLASHQLQRVILAEISEAQMSGRGVIGRNVLAASFGCTFQHAEFNDPVCMGDEPPLYETKSGALIYARISYSDESQADALEPLPLLSKTDTDVSSEDVEEHNHIDLLMQRYRKRINARIAVRNFLVDIGNTHDSAEVVDGVLEVARNAAGTAKLVGTTRTTKSASPFANFDQCSAVLFQETVVPQQEALAALAVTLRLAEGKLCGTAG